MSTLPTCIATVSANVAAGSTPRAPKHTRVHQSFPRKSTDDTEVARSWQTLRLMSPKSSSETYVGGEIDSRCPVPAFKASGATDYIGTTSREPHAENTPVVAIAATS